MKIQIKSRWDGVVVLFETDAESVGAAVLAALKAKANLCGADLRGANLCGANLCGADLCGADLCGAKNLTAKKIEDLLTTRTILPDGDLIGWKKLQGGTICKLQIPAKAKRVGGLVGRKCRAEYVVVLERAGISTHNGLKYKVGKTVKPDKFDDNPLVECSNGIHFFITKQEAMDY